MNTWAYIDGFNLYYGALRKTPYRWLDLKAMLEAHLAKHHQITKIKFFTAKITSTKDPNASLRQKLYLRALETFPEVEIHYGHFLTKVVTMPLEKNPTSPQSYARVIKTEEKGSDVNLATQMLHDAHLNRFTRMAVRI